MKIPITIKAAALALAGVVLGTHPASGALVVNADDILIGFRVANAVSPSYLVNIGSLSQLTALAPGASLSFGSINTTGQDLVDTYGSSWYDLSTLSWGVFGLDTNNLNTIYASRASSTLYTAQNTNPHNQTVSGINAVEGGFTNASSQITTESTNTANAGFQSSGANTYYNAVNGAASDFSSVSTLFIEGNNAAGIDATTLYLQRVGYTTGGITSKSLGSFAIDDTGVVTFTAAVPEPSTYALLAISGVVFVVFLRRRRALQA